MLFGHQGSWRVCTILENLGPSLSLAKQQIPEFHGVVRGINLSPGSLQLDAWILLHDIALYSLSLGLGCFSF